jgi:hypothetical protein
MTGKRCRTGSRTRPAGGLEPRPSGGVRSEDCCGLCLRGVSCRSAVSRKALLAQHLGRRSMVAAKGGRRSHRRIFNDDGLSSRWGSARRSPVTVALPRPRVAVMSAKQDAAGSRSRLLIGWQVWALKKGPLQLPTLRRSLWGFIEMPRSRDPATPRLQSSKTPIDTDNTDPTGCSTGLDWQVIMGRPRATKSL